MNRPNIFFRLLIASLIIFAFLQSCEEQIEPNITPMAEFIFLVNDVSGAPVADATVYLFPFQSLYQDYKDANMDGLSLSDPNISVDNIATSNSEGRVFFPARDLQGNGFASGNSWVYRPNAIYVRVEATHQGNFITNDADASSSRIAFDELGSGDVITITTNVTLR